MLLRVCYRLLQRCHRCIFCLLIMVLVMYIYRLSQYSKPRPTTFNKEQLADHMNQMKSRASWFPQHIATTQELRLNANLSNEIGIYREVPDSVLDECKNKQYDTSNMPTASVIISFHEEIWSVILRTVTSVFFRTPHHLLEEIILVDDASTLESSIKPLEAFLKVIPKVRLIRNPSRQGLVRTRMNGARC